MKNSRVRLLSCLLLFAPTLANGAGQSGSVIPRSPQEHQQAVRQELASMIREAIKQSTFALPQGGTAKTVPLLPAEDYARAKQLGDEATTVLAEYLKSKEFFEQLLAIRLLGVIGTDRSKDVLGEFAEKAELIQTRSYVLDFVATNGRRKDMLLLEKISLRDPAPQVRKEALDLIKRNLNK